MIKEILQKAFILKSKGFYKNAIELFYKALELDNKCLEILLEIAQCYYKMGSEEKALGYIEQVLEKEPSHVDALILLKNIFIEKKAFLEAEKTANNIFLITKKAQDLANVFELMNKQKKYNEVVEYFSDLNSCSINFEKAYANLFLNRLEEAEIFINKALDEIYSYKNILLKCKILYKMNRIDESINLINEIKIDNNAEDMNFLGLVRQYECKFKEAIECFKKSIKLDSKNDEYYYNCASTYFKMGEIQLAKRFYNFAIILAPDNQNYHLALANLYYSEKNYRRALEELNYDFFEAKLLKSIILFDSGYFAIAKKEFEKLSQEEPNNELIINYKALIEDKLRI